jgi:carboxylesterase type B
LLDVITELPSVYGYHSLAFVFAPRPDGTVLIDSPELMVQQGRYAQIPIIIGDQEDEGTFFACFEPNTTTTTEDIVHYFSSIFYPQAPLSMIEGLVATYPDDPAAGSPFRTGLLNNWYPQFKRLAAILGDVTFTPRQRTFLETVASVTPNLPTWSYLASYFHGTPILGTFHTGDILQVLWATLPDYASQAIHAYYYSFIYTQDPNNGSNQIEWPQWNHGQQLMQFDLLDADLLLDDFRSESYNFIKEYNTELSLSLTKSILFVYLFVCLS